MKKKGYILSFFASILMLFSCAMAETQSNPRLFNIIVNDNLAKVYVHKGAGEYQEVLPKDNIYLIDIPAMRGGYSTFLGIKFNKHTPEEYEILKITKENITKEYSIIDIEACQKDEKGNYLIVF